MAGDSRAFMAHKYNPLQGCAGLHSPFFRGVSHFLKTNSLVIHQVKSRINTSSKQKFLIPRYYAYNIMMKEINMLYYYEAALAARAGQIPACYSVPLKETFVAAVIILAFVPAWIVLL